MGPVRPAATGLYLLDAQHGIVLSGGENHQEILQRYAPATGGPPGQVLVELAVVPTAQTGRSGVEARIDGHRIGELSETDAVWYRPLVERAVRHGLRPGGEAHVVFGDVGMLEVELYLPVVDDAAAVESISFPERAPVAAARPAGAHPPARSAPRRARGRVWWAAAVLLVVAMVGASLAVGWWNGTLPRPSADPALPAAGPTTPPSPSPAPAAPPGSVVPPAPPPAALPIARPEPRPPITNGGCDPNYSGGCVPIASRVDCAGQGGQGPLFVRGPLRVIGTDLCELDKDGDGLACEVDPPVPPTTVAPPSSESSRSSDEISGSAAEKPSDEETSTPLDDD